MSDIPAVIIHEVSKSYVMPDKGDLRVLNNVNLDVRENEFICILGYSGCGKTTLLRIVCGFERADSGTVLVDGARHEKPSKNVLMMFQDFNQIFPWKTVLQNVTYPIRMTDSSISKQRAHERAIKFIADVGLQDFKNAYPHQLSGGMKQRVAVARALALQPRVLLMDEPFAALDSITRGKLQKLTKKTLGKYGVTTMLVTHNVEEAVIMADRIVVMNRRGNIERIFENQCKLDAANEDRSALSAEITMLMDQFSLEEQTL